MLCLCCRRQWRRAWTRWSTYAPNAANVSRARRHWPSTTEAIRAKSRSRAPSATSGSRASDTLRATLESTRAKNLTSARCVEKCSAGQSTCGCTWRRTLAKSRTSVRSATTGSQRPAVWRRIGESTPGKSRTSAHCVTAPLASTGRCRITWPFTQAKSCLCVLCAARRSRAWEAWPGTANCIVGNNPRSIPAFVLLHWILHNVLKLADHKGTWFNFTASSRGVH